MSYQALYRKYRLASFEDMVGQDHISNTIKNAIIHDKISHAYLFTGPRGTGKTSIAKLVARAVNCIGEEVLCGQCEICQGIMNNQISDVIEIDAASNNGVDEIRDIRDKVKYAPSSCKYKVYIIDETHMLTTQAFNALLKTLEEPPSHVIFILATTEPHKIPLTILSRCQRFDFRKISETAIVERLNEVIAKENVVISNDALRLIAYLSDGGMRDALSLLDQVSSYISREIIPQDIYDITGTATKDAVENVIKALLSKDKVAILQEINNLNKQGKDLVKLCDSLIVYMRDAMVSANGIKDDLIYKDSECFVKVSELPIEKLYEHISYLSDILYKLKTVHNPKIYLEVSLLNLVETVEEEMSFTQLTNLDTSALFEDSEGEEVTAKQILKQKGIVVTEGGDFDVAGVPVASVPSAPVVEQPVIPTVQEVAPEVEEFVSAPMMEEVTPVVEEFVSAPVVEEATPVVEEFASAPVVEEATPEVEEFTSAPMMEEATPVVEEFASAPVMEEPATEIAPVEDADQDLDDDFNFEDNSGIVTGGEGLSPQDFMEEVDEVEEVVEEVKEELTEDMKKKYFNYLRGVRINNALAEAKKEILVGLKSKWEAIDEHHVSAEKSHLLNILVGSKLRASSNTHLIISVPTEMTVIKVMNNIKDVELITGDVLTVSGYKVTAVSEVEWARIKEDYIKKIKTGQGYDLIREQTINDYYGIKDKRDQLLNKAMDYFGSDKLVVED